MIFPEGTNLTADTKKKSDKFAEENNLSKYEQVLHPRITGFNHLFNEMKRNDTMQYIQDITIAYRGGIIPENEIDFLNGNLPHEIHFYIDKFDCDAILKNVDLSEDGDNSKRNKALEDWLNERWTKKEAFLKKYL